jgi:hypothetical protein
MDKYSRGKILLKALDVINGERQDQYGDPEQSFTEIAKYWSTYLKREISASDVAMMMVLFKIARESHCLKEDNIVDAAGYLGLYSEICSQFKLD